MKMTDSKIKENPRFNYQANFGKANPLYHNLALYEAGVDEFSQKEYEFASLNDILKNAGFAKSTFYYQFGDKLGLYLAIIDIIYQKKRAFYELRLKDVKQDDDFFSTIKSISKDTMDFMFIDKRLYYFSNKTMLAGKELMNIIMKYFKYDSNLLFGSLIEIAQQNKQISRRYSVAFVTNLLKVLFTNIDQLVNEKTADEAYESLNLVFDVLENGIKEK